MREFADYGIDLDTLRRMYDAWQNGATKNELERTFLDAPQAHGKLFSALVREHLGVETEHRSARSERIAALEAEAKGLRVLLRSRGIDPDGGALIDAEE